MHQNPSILKGDLANLLNGLTKTPPDGQTSLLVQGKQVPIPSLVSELGEYVTAYQTVEDTDLAYRNALKARAVVAAQAAVRAQAIRGALKAGLGPQSPNLELYGITPNKTREPLTAAEVQAKVEKAKATRVARHTMGKKQKEAITGAAPSAASVPAKAG